MWAKGVRRRGFPCREPWTTPVSRSSRTAAPPGQHDPRHSTKYSAARTFTVPSVTWGPATSGMIDGTGVFSSVSNWVSAGGVVVECSGGVVTYSSQAIINNVMTTLDVDTGRPGTPSAPTSKSRPPGGTGGSTSVTVEDPTQSFADTRARPGGMVGTYMSVGIDALRDYSSGDVYPPPSFGGLNFSNSKHRRHVAGGVRSGKPISRVSSTGQLEIYTGPIDASGDGFGQLSEPAGTYTPGITAAPASPSVAEDTSNTVTATVAGNSHQRASHRKRQLHRMRPTADAPKPARRRPIRSGAPSRCPPAPVTVPPPPRHP